MRLASLFAMFAIAACGDDGAATPDATSDASPDAFGLPSTCEGMCARTALTATFGSTTRVLNRAFYGITKTASGSTLHVEAHLGAMARCPVETDPPSQYTLVLGKVPIPTSTETSTSPGSMLDFEGDLLGGDPGRRATTVTLMPVAANVCETCVGMPAPSDPDGMIALDAALMFDGGTVTGHLHASHCDSMDTQE